VKIPISFDLAERHVLHGIPSASGMAIIGDSVFVVGDNSPWLFKIDTAGRILDRTLLWPDAHDLPEGIYPKKVKPDIEAMAVVQDGGATTLIMLGSGSHSPQRDVWIEVRLGETPVVSTFPLTAFYAELRSHTGLLENELNIEAVEVVGNELLLFNRGVNLVMRYDLSAVRQFLLEGTNCPTPEFVRVALPMIQGLEAGFSGATMLPGTAQVIFTATVENTSNWIDDGAVMGSFIGMFSLNALHEGIAPPCIMLADTALKVESVAVTDHDGKGTAHLLLVTDADGGASELLSGTLRF